MVGPFIALVHAGHLQLLVNRLLGQGVDAGVGMRPRVRQGDRVEGARVVLDNRQVEQR